MEFRFVCPDQTLKGDNVTAARPLDHPFFVYTVFVFRIQSVIRFSVEESATP